TTWANTATDLKFDFINQSSDRRVTGDETGITDGLYIKYHPAQCHYASRGTYHWSRYRFLKYDYMESASYGFHPIMYKAEMDMLKAEAYLRGYGGGTAADAADLINETRVAIGEMTPLDGTETDLELWRALCYEKRMETLVTGIAYYDYRGWAGLTADGTEVLNVPSGRPIHFPVPAKELEILLQDTYTFGGIGNADTTPGIKAGSKVIDMEYIQNAKAYLDKFKKSNQRMEGIK
ncbi:MAG: RagB/SusD family nutrient uptake outer membrane protein, partial [bacterium]|nr:RagB/SusD family nutrient uptake outer membrane protein [bacterium]